MSSSVQPCSSSPISLRCGSADKVVFPVPERPKKMDVSPFSPTLAEQCIGNTFFSTGKKRFRAVKIPFFISPVYPDPPIRVIFFVKFKMLKFLCLTPYSVGFFSIFLRDQTTSLSSLNFSSLAFFIRRNIFFTKKLDQGYSVMVLTFSR